MCAASFGWCHLVNAYGVKSGWSCGWQVKVCDPVNTCHSVALRDCLGRKNALYKYLILYFYCFTMICVQAWLCHRVGAAGGDKAAAGSLSGERGHGVCIHEYLTPSQDAIYRQADETRQRRPDLIIDCWTFRGRTFVRTSQGEVCEFDSNQFCSKETKTKSCLVM